MGNGYAKVRTAFWMDPTVCIRVCESGEMGFNDHISFDLVT